MKKIYKIDFFAFMLLAFLMAGCQEPTIDELSVENIAVIQSFLTPGTPPVVRLSKVIEFTNDTTIVPDSVITGQSVHIIYEDQVFSLDESTTSPGTYYDSTGALTIMEEKTYDLDFTYNNQVISSTTEVPSKPQDYEISDTTIYVARVTEDSGPGGMPSMDEIEITWDNDNYEYYLIIIKYMEDEYDTINTTRDIDNAEELANFTSEPMQTNMYMLRSMEFSFFGTYQVILSHITSDYASLYESMSQSSLEGLTEPESNIENGKGIFTSFCSDTLQIHIKEE